MTDTDDIPFSDEELVSALEQVMPTEDATELVRALREDLPEAREGNVVGTRLTDDTLDLLHRRFPELAERIRRYRERPWFRDRDR